MNILGIGGWELVVIFIIMLIVAGPDRMLRWAYVMGQYIGKLRRMWEETVDVLQKEVDSAGLDMKVPRNPPTRQSMNRSAREYTKQMLQPLEEVRQEVEEPLKEANKDLRSANNGNRRTTEASSGSGQNDSSDPPTSDFGTWSGKS